MTGFIFDIKKFAIHDGPGVRTTIFLAGCPLNCRWCHNPESRLAFGEWEGNRKVTVDMMIDEISKDSILYEESGGGVTFSGGEPFFQFDFFLELLKTSKASGFHTAVDTSGFTEEENIMKASKYTDLFLYDLKILDGTKHREFTGVDNEKIISNLKRLVSNGNIVNIRIPLIPDFNDDYEVISEMADFLAGISNIKRVDLLPFHRLGLSKYRKLGINSGLDKMKLPDKSNINRAKKIFSDRGLSVAVGG